MPEWLNDPTDFEAVLASLVIVLTGLVALIKMQINKEMKPNGGSSMRDAINRIETKLDRHIEWHLEREEQ